MPHICNKYISPIENSPPPKLITNIQKELENIRDNSTKTFIMVTNTESNVTAKHRMNDQKVKHDSCFWRMFLFLFR